MTQTRTFKAGVLAFGSGLTVVIGLVSSALLARLLSKHEYGTYRQTLLVFITLGPILSLSLPNALSYLLPGETRRARAILFENLALLLGIGGIFGGFLLAGGNRLIATLLASPDLEGTLRFMVPYAALSLPWLAFPACLMVRGWAVPYTITNVLTRLVLFGCVIVPCVLWHTATAAITGTVAAAALAFIPAVVLMIRACPGPDWRPRWDGMATQLRYAAPLSAATVFMILSAMLDKLIVARYCDPATFAIYINGATEVPIVGVITGAATTVLLPELAGLFKQTRPEAMLALWQRSVVKCALVIMPVMAVLLALAGPFVRTLYSPAYAESALPFIIYLLLLPGRVAMYYVMFVASGRNLQLCMLTLVTLCVNAAITFWLVGRLGYMGAALGAVLTQYGCEIPLYLRGMRRIVGGTAPLLPYRDLARIFCASLLAALPVALLARALSVGDFLVLALGGVLYLPLIALLLQRLGYLDLRALAARLRRA